MQNTGLSQKGQLRINSSGNLIVRNSAGTDLATGTTALATNTWYRIEVYVGTGTSANYEVKIDGVSELTGTGNFTTSGTGGDTQIGITNALTNGGVDFFFDNIVFDNAAFPGAAVVKNRKPTANGSTMQWTAGTGSSDYTQVDEIPVSAADYVQSAASVNQVALFTLETTTDLSISGTIAAVKSWGKLRENATGTSSNRIRTRESATNVDTSTRNHGTTGAFSFQVLTTKPSGGAWTTSALDGTEVGSIENNAIAMRGEAFGQMVLYEPASATPTPTPTATNTPGGPTPTPTGTATPTATPTIPATIPAIAEYKDQWIEWSARKYDYLVSQNGWTDPNSAAAQNQLEAHYYDATYHFLRMPTIVATPETAATRIPVLRRSYRDNYVIPNDGAANGFTVFTNGLRKDWEMNGNSTSREAIFDLSRNAAYNSASTPIEETESTLFSRENAYRIIAELDARAVGYDARLVLDSWIDQAIRHIDQWVVDETAPYVRPFMVALTAKALIQAYEEYPDYPEHSSIPTKIGLAYDYIWNCCWLPFDSGNVRSRAFKYTDRTGFDPEDDLGQPDLNGLIVAPFGWLYKVTADSKWRTKGDDVWQGLITTYDEWGFWVRGPFFGPQSTSSSGAKQFNQTYQWSWDYVQFASAVETPTPTPTPTPTITPGGPTVTPTPTQAPQTSLSLLGVGK
jgi:hypothetical protein